MVPKRKKSHARTRTRRAHQALRRPNLVRCPKCGHSKLPHAACEQCGYASPRVLLPREEE